MAEKARLYDPDNDSAQRANEGPSKISGVRLKKKDKPMQNVKDHISYFRLKRLRAGILTDEDKECGKKVVSDMDMSAEGVLSNDVYENKIKELINRVCGKKYVLFLESGHPLARFWVQLKIGIEVIPKSEYIYYLQSVLDMPVNEMETFGTSRMKEAFLKKFGFKDDEEVDEYLETILNEGDVENVIGVE